MNYFLSKISPLLKNENINKADIFISYSHRNKDGIRYAENLHNRLRVNEKNPSKFYDIFIDKRSGISSRTQPEIINEIASRSAMMVIIGHLEAFESAVIKDEIQAFFKYDKEKPLKVIYPKSLSDELKNARWFEEIYESTNSLFETEEKFFKEVAASDSVVESIFDSFTFPTQQELVRKSEEKVKQRGKIALVFTLIAVLAAVLAGVGGVLAINFANDAKQSQSEAETARIEANRANDEKTNAQNQANAAKTDLEKVNGELSNINTQLADTRQQLDEVRPQLEEARNDLAKADKETREAKQQTLVAKKATEAAKQEQARAEKEAAKQRAASNAWELSNESTSLLSQNNPMVLKLSLEKAREANEKVEKNGLSLTEPISSLRRVLAVTPKIVKAHPTSLKSKSACVNLAFSANQKSFACRDGSSVKVYEVSNPERESGEIDFEDDLKGGENNAPVTVHELKVSDDGKTVAASIEIQGFDGNQPDDTYDIFNIVVRTSDGKFYQKAVNKTDSIALSPDGKFLIYSNTYDAGHGKKEKSLTMWEAATDKSKVLNEGLSALSGSFSPEGDYFAAFGKEISTNSLTVVYVFPIPNRNNQNTVPRVSVLNLRYDSVKDIAVDKFGSKVAIKSNGISVWNIYPYPKLEAMIAPKPSAEITSIMFAETSAATEKELVIYNDNNASVVAETWTIKGDMGVSECKECELDSTPILGIRLEGFVSKHPIIEAKIEDEKIIISRKKDAVKIDEIDVGETIQEEGIAISADGTEIITQSYEDSELYTVTRDAEGNEERNYRRWKIGFRNLNEIVGRSLRQFP